MTPWTGDVCVMCGEEYKHWEQDEHSNWIDTEDGWLCTQCVLAADLERHGLTERGEDNG